MYCPFCGNKAEKKEDGSIDCSNCKIILKKIRQESITFMGKEVPVYELKIEEMNECLQCGNTENLTEIKGTNSQYDGSYICDECIERNENELTYDDFN